MKLFQNGIDIKWLLMVIGIVALSGIAIASTNPYITDSGATRLDALNLTYGLKSIGIESGESATIPYAIKIYNRNNLSGWAYAVDALAVDDGDLLIQNFITGVNAIIIDNATGNITFIGNIIATGLSTATPDSDWAICRNPTTKEIKVNTGLTSCASSSEKVKHNIKTINQENLPDNFMKVRPIKFVYNADKTDREKVGFSAEELALIYPEVVATNYGGNGTFIKFIIDSTNPNKAIGALYSDGIIAEIVGVNYEFYTAILTYKLQEQTIVNINQQNDINTLKYEVELLKGNTSAVAPTLISTTTPITTTPWWKFW